MARFAGQALQVTPAQQKPVLPGFNTEDLEVTPELEIRGPQRPGIDLMKDKYIRHNPASGVARSPMEGQEVALAPAVVGGINALTTGIKAYSAYRTGKSIGDAIRDPNTARDRGGMGLGRVTGDLMDGRKEPTNGPTLRSPYHQ